jgi:hypothetical protein
MLRPKWNASSCWGHVKVSSGGTISILYTNRETTLKVIAGNLPKTIAVPVTARVKKT